MKLQIIFTKNKIMMTKKFVEICTTNAFGFFRETLNNDEFGEFV